MNTFFRFALVLAVLTSGSAVMARPVNSSHLPNNTDPYAGYDPNSPQGNRAFWDYQSQHGGH